MAVVYVNSTLAVSRAGTRDGSFSPLHYWGYEPGPGDAVLGHGFGRWEIVLRARLGGLDPKVLVGSMKRLAQRGRFHALYAVTQPDLRQGLPFLRRCFPGAALVTWAWSRDEVLQHWKQYQACSHVLCLAQNAWDAFAEKGEAARASVELWGADPSIYILDEPPEPDRDVLVIGVSNRDTALITRAYPKSGNNFLIMEKLRSVLKLENEERVEWIPFPDTMNKLARMLHRCRVSWIPLKADDPYPTGYTNLNEALFCGTAVVIAESSLIPEEVLSLPGVYRYRNGSEESLLAVTERALEESRQPGFREIVQGAAREKMNGAGLRRRLKDLLQRP